MSAEEEKRKGQHPQPRRGVPLNMYIENVMHWHALVDKTTASITNVTYCKLDLDAKDQFLNSLIRLSSVSKAMSPKWRFKGPNNESQRVPGLDCGQDEKNFPTLALQPLQVPTYFK
ncbi:hypothetical protein PoB_006333800 [Plakobranchus ocellatus]|uniref:Uncharacterized protein n=1 Tax=Plakobranchus ocellatus TaxID=259542 RepID=A0AAV4CYC1_9GAST|nr:hypothetical protein PoB_006333800 [Plakobranchus ocellatus]